MKLLSFFMIFLSLFSSFIHGCSAVKEEGDYLEIEELFLEEVSEAFPGRTLLVCDASDLTEETLVSRGSVVVVERVIGFVDNAETGDGVVMNAADRDFDYINYKDCGQEIRDRTIMLTFLVYEPDDDNVDTIVLREDFILSRAFEGVNAQ